MSKLVTEVPFETLEKCFCAIELALQVLKLGNKNCISDASVAGEMAHAAAYGAYYNVQINLLDLKEDEKYCDEINAKAESIIQKIDKKIIKIREITSLALKHE
tara:strand:- start:85 stop:393 length:309 start_codon:yes stop_codon:yes gene_type:complete